MLCAARVAVEVDRAQHLSERRRVPSGPTQGPDASGERYFVLRFAEDVGEELDLVLDTIVRTLSHRLQSRDLTQPLMLSQASRS